MPEPCPHGRDPRREEPNRRQQDGEAEDRAHDRGAGVVGALIANQDRRELADEEQRGAGDGERGADARAAARAGEAAAREPKQADEDENVQGRPEERDGNERAARPRIAPPVIGDRRGRLNDSLDDDAAERGRRGADDAADTCRAKRLSRWLSPCRPRFPCGWADLLAPTLRTRSRHVIGSTARRTSALVRIRAAVPARWSGRAAGETMTAWTSVRRRPLLRVVIAEKAQPRLRSAVPDGAATRRRAESRRSSGASAS